MPSESTEFLRRILPPEGNGKYCAFLLRGRRNLFFDTIEELAAAMLAYDAVQETVYHACAVFKSAASRKGDNAGAAASLWSDLDCGPKKPYPDARGALLDLGRFCREASFPIPLIVGSGGGWHTYWCLDRALPADEWRELALGLKQLFREHNLHVDPVRTADISSVLRTPGTHNWKPERGGALVRCTGTATQPYSVEDLRRILLPAYQRAGGGSHQPRAAAPSKARTVAAALAASDPASLPPRYVDRIADQCAQLAAYRVSGNIAEPYWHACNGVTAWCVDGREKSHEFSQRDYPGYSAVEVDERLDRILERLTGATTCSQLDAVNPGVCNKCGHRGKIHSPVSLGSTPAVRGPSTDPAGAALAERPTTDLLGEATDGDVADGAAEPHLPPNYIITHQGQLALETAHKKTGHDINLVICNQPLYLMRVQRAESDTHKFSYVFRHDLPHEGKRTFTIDAKVMFGPAAISTLAEKGVIVREYKEFYDFVRNSVDHYHAEQATSVRYDQYGWKGKNFYLGNTLYTPSGKIIVQGGTEAVGRARHFIIKKSASLVQWTEAADALFGTQSAALGACVLASFAAPLMSLVAAVRGGCFLHLFSQQSNTGKSTAMQAAWTVWGDEDGMKLVARDTTVSKFLIMGTMCHLPIMYDELHSKDIEAIREFIDAFSAGRERFRGTVDGTIKIVDLPWCTIFLTNSNHNTIEQLDQSGPDAPGMRMLQLDVPVVSFDNIAGDSLKRRLTENAGTAGDRYLKYLVAPGVKDAITTMLEDLHKDLWTTTKLPPHHRYRILLVAAILAAGAICRHLDILHFDIAKIRDYLITALMDTKNAGAISGLDPIELSHRRLADFLHTYQAEILTVQDKFTPGKAVPQRPTFEPRGRISMRYEITPQRLLISDSVFREWCGKKSYSAADTIAALRDSLLVTSVKKGTLTGGTGLVGVQCLCLEVNCKHPAISGTVASIEQFAQPSADDVGSTVQSST